MKFLSICLLSLGGIFAYTLVFMLSVDVSQQDVGLNLLWFIAAIFGLPALILIVVGGLLYPSVKWLIPIGYTLISVGASVIFVECMLMYLVYLDEAKKIDPEFPEKMAFLTNNFLPSGLMASLLAIAIGFLFLKSGGSVEQTHVDTEID